MKTIISTLIAVFTLFITSHAQNGYEYSDDLKLIYATVFEGDTIPLINIPDIEIISYSFPSPEAESEYERTKRRVEKVYPYYQIAKEVIEEMETEKEALRNKQFKKYKKAKRKELMNQFEKELRSLTTSEGKILVKMINRDTGIAFYDLIKEYNSNAKAWIYNKVANKYGYDLKADYDKEALENYYLELALRSISAMHGVTLD